MSDDCGCWKHDPVDEGCEINHLEDRVKQAIEILQRMRSASQCDFAEMPYWSNEVIKILEGKGSLESTAPEIPVSEDK